MPKFDTMLSAEKVAARVREMGAQISRDYAGKQLVVIGVLLFLGWRRKKNPRAP